MHMNLMEPAENGYKTQFRKFFGNRHLNIDKTQNFSYNYNEDKGRRKNPYLLLMEAL